MPRTVHHPQRASRVIPRMSAYRRGNAAFGVLGLLVVLAIILYIFFGRTGGGSSYVEEIAETKDMGEDLAMTIVVNQLVQLITDYRLNYDKLPESVADLDVPPSSLKDPWGNPVTFTIARPPNRFPEAVIKSDGPDGEARTKDDITVVKSLPF